ncbi:3'-5' exoribonuclease YhaM family protein [Abyssisolibacter fermentans]|uniref:3'-5' exoribonuclease YhaM family protein n=1 Tax=Abyssisolibacter fermentans TaxID=1766203 RepID=UPI000830512C|nr:HD domain-containing protein [Abyssisolibacter fermentans]
MKKTIIEFNNGDNIENFFLVKQASVRRSNNNKKYMDFTLMDKSGEINAKLWDITEKDELQYINNTLIKVRGSVSIWQGKLQLKINKIRLYIESDNIDIKDYVQTAPEESIDMFNCISSYIEKMKNQDIKKLTNRILSDNKDKLMFYPAATKNHHSIAGGLLYHTKTMLLLGEQVCNIYTFLNRDLLYAGVILHDMSKIQEIDATDLGVASEYTTEGQLLGHIIMGIKNIDRVAREEGIDAEISMLLQHMVLSHHYEPEFGSPKKPQIPEGEILHMLDIIDARMYDMNKALSNTKEMEFSEKIWSLDNRKIYKYTDGI